MAPVERGGVGTDSGTAAYAGVADPLESDAAGSPTPRSSDGGGTASTGFAAADSSSAELARLAVKTWGPLHTFAAPDTERAYGALVMLRGKRRALMVSTALAALHLLFSITMTVEEYQHPGGYAHAALSLVWISFVVRALVMALAAAAHTARGAQLVTFARWVPAVSVLTAAADVLLAAASYICSGDSDGSGGGSSGGSAGEAAICYPAQDFSPVLPYGLQLIMPWALPFTLALPWHASAASTLMSCSVAVGLMLSFHTNVELAVPLALVFIVNVAVGALVARQQNDEHRYLFAQHYVLRHHMDLVRAQVRRRKATQRQVQKLAEFMDASQQMLFEAAATYLPPPEAATYADNGPIAHLSATDHVLLTYLCVCQLPCILPCSRCLLCLATHTHHPPAVQVRLHGKRAAAGRPGAHHPGPQRAGRRAT